MKIASFKFAAALVAVAACTAGAQPAQTIEIGAFGQYTKIDDKL